MLDKFISELKETMYKNTFRSVDIIPLVLKYTEGKSEEDVGRIRMSIVHLIKQLATSEMLNVGLDLHSMNTQRFGEYSDEPIYVSGTLKFQDDYESKRPKPMKNSEKIDVILKYLYQFKYDNNKYTVHEILKENGVNVNKMEIRDIAMRLANARLADWTEIHEGIVMSITNEGIDYVEDDSSVKNSKSTKKSIYNFHGNANVINNSSDFTINQNPDNNAMEYLFKIKEEVENDRTLNNERTKLIVETIDEIQEALMKGLNQKRNIGNFLSTLSDISSIGGFVATLQSLIK